MTNIKLNKINFAGVLSALGIDTDKDWGGYNITNLGAGGHDVNAKLNLLDQDVKTTASPTFIGLSLSGLTQGSILFAGSGGLLSQDNSNLFWDNVNKRLGIGTTSPNSKLSVVGGKLYVERTGIAGAVVLNRTDASAGSLVAADVGVGFTFDNNYDFKILPQSRSDVLSGIMSTSDAPFTFTKTGELSLSGLTQGSILFAGSGGLLSQDNSNLFWDNVNKRLGIGTTSPNSKLSVVGGKLYVERTGIAGAVVLNRTDASAGSLVAADVGVGFTFDNNYDFKILPQSRSDVLSGIMSTSDAPFTFTKTGELGIGTTSPNSKLQVAGSVAFQRTAVSADYTTAGDTIIGVTDTSASRTITLASADCVEGRIIIIKDESGGAGTNNITIATEGTEKIDGADTQVINANYGVIRLYSDGANWFIM